MLIAQAKKYQKRKKQSIRSGNQKKEREEAVSFLYLWSTSYRQ